MKLLSILLFITLLPTQNLTAVEIGGAIDLSYKDDSYYSLEKLIFEDKIEEIKPIGVDIGIDALLAVNQIIAGVDLDLDSSIVSDSRKNLSLLTLSGQLGYALFNDENRLVGVLASFGIGAVKSITPREIDLFTLEDSDFVLGTKVVLYFSIMEGIVLEVKALPMNNVLQVISDFDVTLLRKGQRGKDFGTIELSLNPAMKLTNSEYSTDLDVALYVKVNALIAPLYLGPRVKLFFGVGMRKKLDSDDEGTPYFTLGFSAGFSTHSWKSKKKK